MTTWDSIAALARWAPTPHNTQPFRIRPRSDREADVVLLRDRLLPREDHGNLYLASAFGIVAACIERAGLEFGARVAVDAVPELDVPNLHTGPDSIMVGRARITGTCEPAAQRDLIDARRTSRVPYHPRPVSPEAIGAMARAAEQHGHRFISTNDPRVVADTLQLNVDSIIDNLQLDDERNEIRGWYRYGPTPAAGDGLWEGPMNQAAWEMRAAFGMPRVFALPGIRQLSARRYLRTQRGTRHVGLLCGAFREWSDLVRAGRMLMEFWLAMTEHDVYMHPMGSMLTNAHYAAEIARRFGVDDCWLVFRFGYSDPPVRSPRLESILIHE